MRRLALILLLLSTPSLASDDLPVGAVIAKAGKHANVPAGWVRADGNASCEVYRELCDLLPPEAKVGGVVSIDMKGKICSPDGRCRPDGVTWIIKAR